MGNIFINLNSYTLGNEMSQHLRLYITVLEFLRIALVPQNP